MTIDSPLCGGFRVRVVGNLLAAELLKTTSRKRAPLNESRNRAVFQFQNPSPSDVGYGLKSRFDRLRERGMRTISEMAKACGVSINTIGHWRQKGQRRAGSCWGPWPRHSQPPSCTLSG
jgi:hypothetical protein